jgi:hypothetical protein
MEDGRMSERFGIVFNHRFVQLEKGRRLHIV